MTIASGKSSRASQDDLPRAVETFVRGFCLTRSFTHPYVGERIEIVWVIRDAPRKSGTYRREEWIAHDADPVAVHDTARKHTRGGYCVCHLHRTDEPDADLRAAYKKLHYRLNGTEPMFVHRLKRIPRCASPARIERVMDEELATRLAKAARSRQVMTEHLTDDADLRQYVAVLDEQLVGWVRSIRVGDSTWCSNMFVEPAFRRRGIARSLLSRMLCDDRKYGAKQAVLLASHAGAKLYPVVGYEQIATLLLFTPKKS